MPLVALGARQLIKHGMSSELSRKLSSFYICIKKKGQLLALVFDSFDGNDGSRIKLIHSLGSWLAFALFALQRAAYHVAIQSNWVVIIV